MFWYKECIIIIRFESFGKTRSQGSQLLPIGRSCWKTTVTSTSPEIYFIWQCVGNWLFIWQCFGSNCLRNVFFGNVLSIIAWGLYCGKCLAITTWEMLFLVMFCKFLPKRYFHLTLLWLRVFYLAIYWQSLPFASTCFGATMIW